jgi:hypothetical protein
MATLISGKDHKNILRLAKIPSDAQPIRLLSPMEVLGFVPCWENDQWQDPEACVGEEVDL